MAFKWLKRKKDSKDDTPSQEIPPSESTDEDHNGHASPLIEGTSEPVDVKPPEADTEKDLAETASPADIAAEETAPARTGFMSRLRRGLTKTRDFLNTDIEDLFSGKRQIDDDLLEELEELLITADIGVQTTMDLMDAISRKASQIVSPEDLKAILKEEIMAIVDTAPATDRSGAPPRPKVIMVVGVNGVGKTTTIGKLAARYRREGKKVLIAASDTFRAAAIEQLSIWADRAGADIVKHKDQSDPAAVAFDAVEAAIARGVDIVLVDTAGRLHTKVNLMEELKKIKRSLSKKSADAPHETLLVLDATTGQNALSQARLFDEAINLSALALTKLDGTAKGGIVVSICSTLNIPLKYVGVGEQIDDLQDFDPRQFVDALF
ncbi:MAG: signal recognition particle-docking protein FtsY [Desulfobacteraceae bacterium]|nr:signal recognition particle-docking protein FtsY [Desulfobacteraceae bacterium]MBC2749179.1 signal recognition particle-docking protein FtsY [Desulfobacteraceae bacterium]